MVKVKVIGAGGIGSALLPVLARYLNFANGEATVTVIDGDSYEMKNQARQIFSRIGNKAEVSAESLSHSFPRLLFRAKGEYVTDDSAEYLIEDCDIVFLCVDNHKSRKLVSSYCEEMDDIVLISGGNEYTDGNVQIFVRKGGKNLTLPIANEYHPEIVNPSDKNPDEVGCGEVSESVPQLVFTNNAVAAVMLNVFYAYTQGKINYDEVFLDVVTNNCRAVCRSQRSAAL